MSNTMFYEKDYWVRENVIYTRNYDDRPDERGIGWVYFESMLKNKDRLAQLNGVSGETDTFSTLLQRCVRTSIGLKSLGVQYGDVISVCTYNHFNSCVPHISAMFLGVKMAALDPSLSLPDALRLFQLVRPKVIFVGLESVELIENVVRIIESETILVVFGPTEKHVPFCYFTKTTANETDFIPTAAKSIRDVAVIFFSSGTTGLPKGICHTHFSLLRDLSSAAKIDSVSALTYATDSPYWNVFLIFLNYSIVNGTGRVIYSKFDHTNPWKIFSQKVTLTMLNITELMTLYNTEKPASTDTKALRMVIIGGSPVNKQQVVKARTLFPNIPIRITYSQSEVFPTTLTFDITNHNHIEFLTKKTNSCGLPKRGITYKIADLETNKALGPNQKGELRVKTDAQLSGYYNTDSSGIWDADGWLKTGDYGYYDEDFCFYIVDRVKEMFKYQYWHIVPAVLEDLLVTHPAVLKAVVIGVPHEVDEHHPMAFVQLKPESSATEEEIRKYFDEKVEDRQKLRGGVKFLKNIPLTPTGKVNRWGLKQMVVNRNNE